jgi:superfamily II DNA or RNA helicase
MEMFCPVVFRYKTDDAVSDKILNDYRIVVHPIHLGTENQLHIKTKSGKQWWTSEKGNYDYWSNRIDSAFRHNEVSLLRIQRMRSMMTYYSKEVYAKKLFDTIQDKCILFVNTQEQADKLCTHSYHSNNPDSEQNLEDFKNGKINKLASVLQLNEGVNIPNLKSCIILHSYSSNTKTAQRLGRILRLNPEETATVHILVYHETIDVVWVKEALKDFDPFKITWQEPQRVHK